MGRGTMSYGDAAITGFDPVEVFKLLVWNGYQQTANEFWNENFACALMSKAPESMRAGLSMLGEMSRWVREAGSNEQEGNGSAAAADETWIWIVAKGIEEYTTFPNDPSNKQRLEYREKLMLAWDDSDGVILAEAIARMQSGGPAADDMIGEQDPNAD
jgi:hypothetical protein